MKCFFCKEEYPEDELAEVTITPKDENGNVIGESKTLNVCEQCIYDKIIGNRSVKK